MRWIRQNAPLRRLERWLEGPMVVLAFVWISLLIVEFAGGEARWLERASDGIWIVFVVDFALRFGLARGKLLYLRQNWLTLVSLALPALRVFRLTRLLRLSRATRGLRLLRLTTSVNRSMRALMRSMGRKGAGYVVALTLIVTFAGAAGMYTLEAGAFASYWDALWWTSMIVATMGSDFWPRTPEGRLLCFALAVYAFSVFGYVTAALASFFVEREQPSEQRDAGALHEELSELRKEMARVVAALEDGATSGRAPRR